MEYLPYVDFAGGILVGVDADEFEILSWVLNLFLPLV